jgi:hypothetical protein
MSNPYYSAFGTMCSKKKSVSKELTWSSRSQMTYSETVDLGG